MEKVSIKIVIAGRSYPLTINEKEEDFVRSAVEEINTNIQKLQDNYAVKDMQDLLAMTTLQLATRKKETTSDLKEDTNNIEVLKTLQQLSHSIDSE